MRRAKLMTANAVEAIIRSGQPGRYADGGGLYLEIMPSGTYHWLLRIRAGGRRREFGLGSGRYVSLEEARAKAAEYRKLLMAGGDPTVRGRTKPHGSLTFKEAAAEFFAEHSKGMTGEKGKAQWMTTMAAHAFEPLGRMPVAEVDTYAVRKQLLPIWTTKQTTARIVRQRIGQVLDCAKANKLRSGDNPVKELNMPAQTAPVRHHPALPHEEVCRFIATLRNSTADLAVQLAFEFLVLTVVRTTELLGARWEEVDWAERTWTVPAVRMKGERRKRAPRSHVVLLSDRAIEILHTAKEKLNGDEFVFPSPRRPRKSLSTGAFESYIDRVGMTGKVSPHGFRSTFRRWAGTETNADKDAVETSMAHTIGNAVERAYWRNDPMIKKRRSLMQAWGDYVTGRKADADNIVVLRAG
jgi:integrase